LNSIKPPIHWHYEKLCIHPSFTPRRKLCQIGPAAYLKLRLPELMIEALKLLADKHDIPYQSLMKMYLAERIQRELKSIGTKQ
jgi:hypothetical protein